MLTHFIVILPLLLTVVGKQQFKQVLCDINLERDGKAFDETICLVKDSEDRRSVRYEIGPMRAYPSDTPNRRPQQIDPTHWQSLQRRG